MKAFKIFVPFLLLITASCVTLVKWKYGITEPREETPASLLKFLQKMNQPPEDFYIFKDSAAFCHYLNDSVFRKNLIGSLFFNQEGLLTDIKDTAKCQWSVSSFLQNLDHKRAFKVDSAYRYQNVLSHLMPLVRNGITDSLLGSYNYIVLITWGRFAGKLNKRLFDAAEMANEKRNKGVHIAFINIDMQKSWKLRKNQKMILK